MATAQVETTCHVSMTSIQMSRTYENCCVGIAAPSHSSAWKVEPGDTCSKLASQTCHSELWVQLRDSMKKGKAIEEDTQNQPWPPDMPTHVPANTRGPILMQTHTYIRKRRWNYTMGSLSAFLNFFVFQNQLLTSAFYPYSIRKLILKKKSIHDLSNKPKNLAVVSDFPHITC